MQYLSPKKLLLAAGLLVSSALYAQPDNRRPIEVMQKVGDKIIANAPFAYRLTLPPLKKEFDFIQFVDFARTFDLGKPAVAYALSTIEAKNDTSIVLEISHNDGAKVWINNELVYEKSGDRKVKIETKERNILLDSEFKANLKRGANTILVKSETKGNEWIFYIQPKGALIEFSPVKNLKLTSANLPNVAPEVSNLSNWLVIGMFPNAVQNGQRIGLQTVYGPEKEFTIGKLYTDGGSKIAWTIPKVEVFANVINPHPSWGTLYNFNYHTAGVAWAMKKLGEQSGVKKYEDYTKRYCDFMLKGKDFIEYQVKDMNGYRSVQHHMINTPLLDFTAAPALPFQYMLIKNKEFDTRPLYEAFYSKIKQYIVKDQIRLPDGYGTFMRETPEKNTVWVDDMYMGLPFLLQAATESKDPKEKKAFLDDAANQVIGFNKMVYDPKANLYHHAQHTQRKANMPYWSRANGWGVFAASEVLLHLPKNHPRYKQVLAIYKNHVDALVKYQNANGFWHNILNDPTSAEETSGTAIHTMAIARGVNNGWLPRKQYEKYALKGWDALKSVIETDGTVHKIIVGAMTSEDANYYKGRPMVDDDSHGLLGLLFAGMELDKMMYPNGKATNTSIK